MPELLGPELVPAILDAGYNFDFIDSAAIDRVGIHYAVLVIPNIERLPLATWRRIADYARGGGVVLATQSLPSRAPGFLESPRDTAAIRELSRELFAPDAKKRKAGPRNTSTSARRSPEFLKPDVAIEPATPEVGFIHRRLPEADIYFIANTAIARTNFTATFRTEKRGAEWWDPFSGTSSRAGSGPVLKVALAPYESRVVVFTDHAQPGKVQPTVTYFDPID